MKEVYISVIIPVYNAENYLKECIDSVLNQTYSYFEVILINDGSTDNSKDICDSYSRMDERVKVITQKNAGVSVARNTGLKNAKGDYIIFMDSDDYIEPDMYEKMICVINEYNCDLVMCDCIKEFVDKSILYTHDIRGGFYNSKQLKKEYYPMLLVTQNLEYPATISNCLLMIRKKILKNKYYEPGIRFSEDWLFGAEVIINCKSFYYMKGQSFYHYRINPHSTTHKENIDKWTDFKKLYDKFVEKFGNLQDYSFEQQLNYVLLFLVYNSIGNICSSSITLKQKKKYIYEIIKDDRVVNMFKNIKVFKLGISKKQKFITLLYKYRIGIVFLIFYYKNIHS